MIKVTYASRSRGLAVMKTVRNPASSMQLDQLSIGERAKIINIDGGRNMIRRLLALGLTVGTEIDVVQRRGRAVVVGKSGNRVAIGESISQRLQVQPLPKKCA